MNGSVSGPCVTEPQVPVLGDSTKKLRMFKIRCGDDDKFETCLSDLNETAGNHIRRIYQVRYSHTEPGCCQLLTDSRLTWMNEYDLRRKGTAVFEIKEVDVIGIFHHAECGMYGKKYGAMTVSQELERHTEDLVVAKSVLGDMFPKLVKEKEVKILIFFMDRSGHIRPMDEETRIIHEQQLVRAPRLEKARVR